ncbi:MAG: hypothetical protein GY733_23235 [bacterium]|nr:hypothetical protein [bacterium]
MTRLSRITVVLFAVLLISTQGGCLYFNVKAPLDTNLEQTQLGAKVGTSEAHSVLGLFAWGDASTQAAAEEGEITTIQHADQEQFAVLGFVYARYRTVVYGD